MRLWFRKKIVTENATLGGGCFWYLEAIFRELRGVHKVVSGYAGGTVPFPTYEEVCSGRTGHAEVVHITYDPLEIAFQELLLVFFTVHDPTTLNRQDADVGPQYRSVICYHTPEQKAAAQEMIARLNRRRIWSWPIVTELCLLEAFYPAEKYHQEYFRRNPNKPYSRGVVVPKLDRFRKKFGDKLR